MNARTDFSLLAAPELSFATIASGICVPYVECGQGEPLVFVHGSLCDYRYWSAQTAALSEHFRCISVSLSHYWPANEACIQGEFGWQTHVAELAEFIEALDIAPVHLVGHSRGGCVAFHMAREYPRLVKTLTLADPGGPLQMDGMAESRAAGRDECAARARGGVDRRRRDRSGARAFRRLRECARARGARVRLRFARWPPTTQRPCRSSFAIRCPRIRVRPRVGIQCRTLLIEGQRSPRMFRNNVEKLAEWIDYADKQTIAGASHGMNVSNAGAFNRLVHSFASF